MVWRCVGRQRKARGTAKAERAAAEAAMREEWRADPAGDSAVERWRAAQSQEVGRAMGRYAAWVGEQEQRVPPRRVREARKRVAGSAWHTCSEHDRKLVEDWKQGHSATAAAKRQRRILAQAQRRAEKRCERAGIDVEQTRGASRRRRAQTAAKEEKEQLKKIATALAERREERRKVAAEAEIDEAEEALACEAREAQCRAKATQLLLDATWGRGRKREGEGPNRVERAALAARAAGQRKRERMRRPQTAHLDGRARCSVRDMSGSAEAEEARRQRRTPRGALSTALPDNWTPRGREILPACIGWHPSTCSPSAQGETMHGMRLKRARPPSEEEVTVAQLRVEANRIPQSAEGWVQAEVQAGKRCAKRRRRLWAAEDSGREEGGVGSSSEGSVIGRDEHIHFHA